MPGYKASAECKPGATFTVVVIVAALSANITTTMTVAIIAQDAKLQVYTCCCLHLFTPNLTVAAVATNDNIHII